MRVEGGDRIVRRVCGIWGGDGGGGGGNGREERVTGGRFLAALEGYPVESVSELLGQDTTRRRQETAEEIPVSPLVNVPEMRAHGVVFVVGIVGIVVTVVVLGGGGRWPGECRWRSAGRRRDRGLVEIEEEPCRAGRGRGHWGGGGIQGVIPRDFWGVYLAYWAPSAGRWA